MSEKLLKKALAKANRRSPSRGARSRCDAGGSDFVIRLDDGGRLDEWGIRGRRGDPHVHVERMDYDAWVVVASVGETHLLGAFWVEWRWRQLDTSGWRRFVWFPWPHLEGRLEPE